MSECMLNGKIILSVAYMYKEGKIKATETRFLLVPDDRNELIVKKTRYGYCHLGWVIFYKSFPTPVMSLIADYLLRFSIVLTMFYGRYSILLFPDVQVWV